MHNIRLKLSILLVTFISITFIVSYFINAIFLDQFYINQKKTTLVNMYNSINDIFSSGKDLTDKDEDYIIKICESNGVTLLVTNSAGYSEFNYGTNSKLEARLQYLLLTGGSDNINIIQKTDNYVIQSIVDNNTYSSYLEMWGVLGNGKYFIVRMAYESVKESVDISNRFFGYIGFSMILITGIVMLFFTRNFTRPILELSYIAERMSNLDFDIKYIGTSHDEIEVLGNSINQLSEKLEKNISDLKTANNELKKDLAKKTEIDEVRKEFLSNVSHELKSPIALIQGYAEGLKESVNDDPEGRNFYCDVIMDEANKMNNIVKKLLTLNQIEFGNDNVKLERFDIISVISGILNSSNILLKQKEITVYFDDRTPVYVWSDEFQTEEVFTNFLSNAINHVDDNKTIRIHVNKTEGNVRVSVFNTGLHIPEDDIDKIWQKFYKVDKARTREYGGSGIGLSIVKAIQDSLNKGYGVENAEGGVEFWFDIDAD
jgi:two-component system sensor histidine kinase VanS